MTSLHSCSVRTVRTLRLG